MINWNEVFDACVEIPGPKWFAFVQKVGRVRNDRWRTAREVEADRLAPTMDMTPEGYVREWVGRGRKGGTMPLDAWEHAYNRAGITEQAQRLGYIEIGRDVACTVTLTPKGEALANAVDMTTKKAATPKDDDL